MAYDAHAFRARAVHTDRPTLATAAYMDWSAELRRLHELRHGREVLVLCGWCADRFRGVSKRARVL